jgi:glycosyltransferase involved in cell wall biosynthesis
VSEFVREHLVTQWRLPPERVGLVYHGLPGEAQPRAAHAPAALRELPRTVPMLFTAGSIRPARGLEDILYAMPAILSAAPGAVLAIAGGLDAGATLYHHTRLLQLIDRLGLRAHVVWTGHLGAAEMAWCFQRAAAFVMTSRAEACPNTALEAMSHGSIIVSTDTQPMPEFFQSAAVYYRARRADSLAAAVIGILEMNDVRRGTLSGAAAERAGHFSWDRTADFTVLELTRAVHRSVSSSEPGEQG